MHELQAKSLPRNGRRKRQVFGQKHCQWTQFRRNLRRSRSKHSSLSRECRAPNRRNLRRSRQSSSSLTWKCNRWSGNSTASLSRGKRNWTTKNTKETKGRQRRRAPDETPIDTDEAPSRKGL